MTKPAERASLVQMVCDYATHASWRCAYQSRYPWHSDSEGTIVDCRCGLVGDLLANGLPAEWADITDPEGGDGS